MQVAVITMPDAGSAQIEKLLNSLQLFWGLVCGTGIGHSSVSGCDLMNLNNMVMRYRVLTYQLGFLSMI
jgi:hypothetical protein